jgi:molecular chaperone DnaK (HSP70)
MHLGGEDFDNALANYVIEKANIKEDKIRKNNQAVKRLKVACENAKKILSSSDKTTIRINNVLDKIDINVEITKDEFERICQPLIDKLNIPLNSAISEAEKKMRELNRKFSKEDIDEVILIGGSTRIPKVKEFVKDFFPSKRINDSINPDEAVAYGATLQAEKLLYNSDKINDEIKNEFLKYAFDSQIGNKLLLITFIAKKTIDENEFMEQLEKNYGVYLDVDNFIKKMKTKLNEIKTYKQLFEYLESDFGKNKTNLEIIKDAYEKAKFKGYIERDKIKKKKVNKDNNTKKEKKEKKATVNFDDDENEEYIEDYSDDDNDYDEDEEEGEEGEEEEDE